MFCHSSFAFNLSEDVTSISHDGILLSREIFQVKMCGLGVPIMRFILSSVNPAIRLSDRAMRVAIGTIHGVIHLGLQFEEVLAITSVQGVFKQAQRTSLPRIRP